MNRQGLYLATLLSVIVVSLTVIPAYAEVTSLKTNAPFYKGGSKIYFSGTILDTDRTTVTMLIFDPTGQYIIMPPQGLANSTTHQFQIVLDTSIPENQQKLSMKGVYNATAFVNSEQSGKTVSFVFSPDGSPVIPSPPTSLTASTPSSTEIDLMWSGPSNNGGSIITGYEIERSTNSGSTWNTIISNTNSASTSYSDTGLSPSTVYTYRISAINSGGTSTPSNVVTASTLSPPTQTTSTPGSTTDQSSGPSLDELLKKRLEDAKRLQDLLNAKNSGSPSTTVHAQTIQLSEKMAVGDVASNPVVQKPANTPGNNLMPSLANFNVNTVIYPIISLVGVGIVVFILYLRKKQKLSTNSIEIKKETPVPEVPSEQKDDQDHAMIILKNRLAKGEITVDEFKELKEELSEP